MTTHRFPNRCVLTAACFTVAVGLGTALGSPPFGGDDNGFVPPDVATAKCEDTVVKRLAKLLKALGTCHLKTGAAARTGKVFDEEGCEAAAQAGFDAAVEKLVGCPACLPPAQSISEQAESTVNQNNGVIACAPGTPFGGDDTGFVASDPAAATCEMRVERSFFTLEAAILTCHVKAADAGFAGKPFDEEACEAAALSRYTGANARLTGCPPCLDAPAIGLAAEQTLDALNGDFYCAGAPPPPACGDTSPTCNGSCPVGEECGAVTGPEAGSLCGCIPAGSIPCGTVSTGSAAAPQCDGACPPGLYCRAGGRSFCDCMQPAPPCGQGAGAPACWGECPASEPYCIDAGGACVCSSVSCASYLSFTQGAPGAPGDRVLVTGTDPLTSDAFDLALPVALGPLSNGFVLTLFPPAGTQLNEINFVASKVALAPGCDVGVVYAVGTHQFPGTTVVVNGVTGFVLTVPAADIQLWVNELNSGQPSCGVTANDLVIDRIGAGIDLSTFLTTLDAASLCPAS